MDGKLILDARGVFAGYLLTLKNKPVELILRVKRRQRTQKQSAWYRGCVVPMIAAYCGYPLHEYDALHDALVRRFLGERPDPNPLRLRISTSDLTTAEFSEYCEQVRIWAATDLGVVIPDPAQTE
jgi:hypothetical protein